MTESSTTSISKINKSEQGLTVIGELVFSNIANLHADSEALLKHHVANSNEAESLIIDCKQMTRIDSAGIALLLEWQRQLIQLNKHCVFKDLSTQALSLISAYHLKSLLKT